MKEIRNEGWRASGLEGFRTGWIHDRIDSGLEGYGKEGIQESSDAGKER